VGRQQQDQHSRQVAHACDGCVVHIPLLLGLMVYDKLPR